MGRTIAHKVVINTLSEGENLLGVSLVEALGKDRSDVTKQCNDVECFNLENFIIDYAELSPTAELCGASVRELVYLDVIEPDLTMNVTEQNTAVDGTLQRKTIVFSYQWQPKSEYNLQYTVSLPILIPSSVNGTSNINDYIDRWLRTQATKQAFAFDGVDSIKVSDPVCDERHEVCFVDADVELYRNTGLFRDPNRLERLAYSYELYHTLVVVS